MYLSRFYPTPKCFTEIKAEPFRFGAKVTMTVPTALNADIAANLKKLWNSFSFTASELTLDARAEGWTAVIGRPPQDDREVVYYTIKSDAEGILLRAADERAFIDALSTLVQLITPECLDVGKESLYILPTEIADEPKTKFRSIHICIFPESAVHTIHKTIELAGFLKLTHIVLEFWGTFPYRSHRSLYWPQSVWSEDTVRETVKLCRENGLEVIPMINMFGHASQARGGMGRHVTLNQDPRMQMYFEPDGWTWCLSNPDTYKLLSDMRAEISDLCGSGSYFHVGFDEAHSFATCPKCRERVPHELLAEFVNRLTEDIVKDGRRPIMWHDELIKRDDFVGTTECPIVANGHYHNTDAALELIDRRMIIADWQYSYTNDKNPTARYFTDKGFDTILCPFDDMRNIRSLCRSAQELDAYGVMLTTWHHLPAFLLKLFDASELMWQDSGKPTSNLEAAAVLRKLHTSPEFDEAGWNKFEVEQ